jgi:hypothetical protein
MQPSFFLYSKWAIIWSFLYTNLACKIYGLPSWMLESSPWAHTNVAHYLSPLATIAKMQSRTNKDDGNIECQWKEGFYSFSTWICICYKDFYVLRSILNPMPSISWRHTIATFDKRISTTRCSRP